MSRDCLDSSLSLLLSLAVSLSTWDCNPKINTRVANIETAIKHTNSGGSVCVCQQKRKKSVAGVGGYRTGVACVGRLPWRRQESDSPLKMSQYIILSSLHFLASSFSFSHSSQGEHDSMLRNCVCVCLVLLFPFVILNISFILTHHHENLPFNLPFALKINL